jgi:hypothetical protein
MKTHAADSFLSVPVLGGNSTSSAVAMMNVTMLPRLPIISASDDQCGQ